VSNHVSVRPYADHRDDGIVQLSFTLPVPDGPAARRAALDTVASMGLIRAEVVHQQELTAGYTYFIAYAHYTGVIEFSPDLLDDTETRPFGQHEVEKFIDQHLGREVTVVGAATGTDTHSVGIDAIMNLKGFDGHHGLEAYRGFQAHNMGSQVPNTELVAMAIEVNADAILVSQTVTQQYLHISNLTNLVEITEAQGLRERTLLICGGPRMTNELAKELGYDAGFAKGTYPNQVATFIVRELAARSGGHQAPTPGDPADGIRTMN
jgi:beta-lysine 5,6-aminomutase beta subunit